MGVLDDFFKFLTQIFSGPSAPSPTPPVSEDEPLVTLSPRVLVINFDPEVDDQHTRLSAKMGWNNVDQLIADCIADIAEASYGLVKYQVVDRKDVNYIPVKKDTFQYKVADYIAMMNDPAHAAAHQPDLVNYWQIVTDFNLIPRVMNNEIDEVWMFGGPYFGFWESTMVGRYAFWTNSDPLEMSSNCTRRFIIMGFNPEREVGEMIHDIGHRTESIMAKVYGTLDYQSYVYDKMTHGLPIDLSQCNPLKNDYMRFMAFDKISPGQAGVGFVHFPPNAEKDYDLSNPRSVTSGCDDWLNFPKLQGVTRTVTCADWGTDERSHMKWWFKRLPHAAGRSNGISNNWWNYIMKVDQLFFDHP